MLCGVGVQDGPGSAPGAGRATDERLRVTIGVAWEDDGPGSEPGAGRATEGRLRVVSEIDGKVEGLR